MSPFGSGGHTNEDRQPKRRNKPRALRRSNDDSPRGSVNRFFKQAA
jgi:hypothetical protein